MNFPTDNKNRWQKRKVIAYIIFKVASVIELNIYIYCSFNDSHCLHTNNFSISSFVKFPSTLYFQCALSYSFNEFLKKKDACSSTYHNQNKSKYTRQSRTSFTPSTCSLRYHLCILISSRSHSPSTSTTASPFFPALPTLPARCK